MYAPLAVGLWHVVAGGIIVAVAVVAVYLRLTD
jgi:hypothetical protein